MYFENIPLTNKLAVTLLCMVKIIVYCSSFVVYGEDYSLLLLRREFLTLAISKRGYFKGLLIPQATANRTYYNLRLNT